MNSEAIANLVHHNNKRKSKEEQPEQPTAKYACLGQVSSADSEDESSNNNLQGSSLQAPLVGTSILQSASGSEPDSEKGSNSFPAYSDSTTCSSFSKTKSDPEYSNAYAYSHTVGEFDSFESTAVSHQEFPCLDLKDHLLELEMHGSECGNELMELGEEKELQIEDLLYSNEAVNPNMLVLSSGRWIINQDAQPPARKPTIDQEFEQYFSSLML